MEISCEHIMIQVLECLPGPSGSFSPVVVKINTFLNGLKISGVFLEIIFFYDIIKTTVDFIIRFESVCAWGKTQEAAHA